MTPRELVVISGKGGTGKTSVVAAFAALAGGAVLADCDVDAADLHLVLRPETGREHRSAAANRRSSIRRLHGLRRCAEVCRFAAMLGSAEEGYSVDSIACEGWSCAGGSVRQRPSAWSPW